MGIVAAGLVFPGGKGRGEVGDIEIIQVVALEAADNLPKLAAIPAPGGEGHNQILIAMLAGYPFEFGNITVGRANPLRQLPVPQFGCDLWRLQGAC